MSGRGMVIIKEAVLQRVRELARYYNLSDNAFAKKIGIPQATLSGWYNLGRTPSMDMITTLLCVFPNLSAEWLLRGEGKMFKEDDSSAVNSKTNIKQSQCSGIGMSLYGRIIKAIMRGCSNKEEQDEMIGVLEKFCNK